MLTSFTEDVLLEKDYLLLNLKVKIIMDLSQVLGTAGEG